MKCALIALTISYGLMLPAAALAQQEPHNAGAVFVMTNAADKNEVIAYSRAADGSLQEGQRFATGGRGSGGATDPLGSQGSLLLSQDGSLLFAANAGTGDISVFRVTGSRLFLAQREPSGGAAPNALAQSGNLLYVINSGGTSGVSGFRIAASGRLNPIPNSVRYFSTGITAASSLAFSPNGAFLLAVERLTNIIDVFAVQGDGTLVQKSALQSTVPGAFSVAFAPNGTVLVVATGPSGAINGSAISSYALASGGTLAAISVNVPTLGAATCWHAVTPSGQFVLTSNAGTSSLSAFSIGSTGSLTPVAGTVVITQAAGSGNLDIAISSDGKFLYTLNSGAGNVGIYAIQTNGTLTTVGTMSGIGITHGLNGIAAF
jgi:6-phosphogluconolactonase